MVGEQKLGNTNGTYSTTYLERYRLGDNCEYFVDDIVGKLVGRGAELGEPGVVLQRGDDAD